MNRFELEEINIKVETANGIIKAYEFGIFENPFSGEYLERMRLGYIQAIDILDEVNEEMRKIINYDQGE